MVPQFVNAKLVDNSNDSRHGLWYIYIYTYYGL